MRVRRGAPAWAPWCRRLRVKGRPHGVAPAIQPPDQVRGRLLTHGSGMATWFFESEERAHVKEVNGAVLGGERDQVASRAVRAVGYTMSKIDRRGSLLRRTAFGGAESDGNIVGTIGGKVNRNRAEAKARRQVRAFPRPLGAGGICVAARQRIDWPSELQESFLACRRETPPQPPPTRGGGMEGLDQ